MEQTYIQKVELNLSQVKSVCLDHSCIIQNFFKNAIPKMGETSFDGAHDRNNRRVLDHRHNDLERYDDLNLILTRFKDYLQGKADHPTLLHAHSVDKKGDPIQASWEAPIRFFSNRNIKPLSDALYKYTGKGVFLTLTVDHTRTLRQAWENIAKRWNVFLTRLSIETGIPRRHLHYIWVLEAQGNGYPHIHALFLGIDYLFWAGNKREWIGDNPHSKNLKHFWKWGSVYVNTTKSGSTIESPVSYLMKYIRKTWNADPDSKALLTQAMLWVFDKRSWNVSRSLPGYLKIEKPKKTDWKLHSIHSFEYLHGQFTPWIRLRKPGHILKILSESDKYGQEKRPVEIMTWLRVKSKHLDNDTTVWPNC